MLNHSILKAVCSSLIFVAARFCNGYTIHHKFPECSPIQFWQHHTGITHCWSELNGWVQKIMKQSSLKIPHRVFRRISRPNPYHVNIPPHHHRINTSLCSALLTIGVHGLYKPKTTRNVPHQTAQHN